jgi:hypothetical protein
MATGYESLEGEPSPPVLLEQMRAVWNNDPVARPEPAAITNLRVLLRDSLRAFVEQMTALERGHQATVKAWLDKMKVPQPEAQASPEGPPDPSEGRARKLIHQLLEECREQAQAT